MTNVETLYKNTVKALVEQGIQLSLFKDDGKRSRAVYSTKKRQLDIELLIKNGKIGLRIANRLPTKNPVRSEMNEKITSQLAVLGYTKDGSLSTSHYPTFLSQDLITDTKVFIDTVELNEEFEDSIGNTWKVNGGLEAGTWHIVDTIRSAVKRGHTSALNREMYECLRTQVELNKYDADNGLIWGEHVVPIDFMTQTLCTMAKEGASDDAMFDFLMRNHKVVYIKDEDAHKMDRDLKLQTVMTEGWKDGDSPFARLDAANITIVK